MWPAIIAAATSMMNSGGNGSGGGGGGGWQSFMPSSKIGGIANGLFNLFFAKNPSDAANPFLQQIEGGAGKYLNPFIDSASRARPILEGEFSRNVNDPTSVMNQIGKGFHESPGYDWNKSQMEDASKRAFAASGMVGSPAHARAISQDINGLANQDYYNFMDRGLESYKTGLGGWGNMYGIGANAANNMSQILMQQLLAQAQNAYSGANTYNQQKGGAIGSIIGGFT